jgi:hypothetical protein
VVCAERPANGGDGLRGANVLSQAVYQVLPAAAAKTAEVHELTVSLESESDATWKATDG